MTQRKPVTDTELQAYLDGQLDAEQRQEIERELQHDAQAREKLEAYQSINQSLHQLYDPVLEEEIPQRLLPRTRYGSFYRAMAASTVIFMLGSLFGWQATQQLAKNPIPLSPTEVNLVQPAAFAHSVYSVEVVHPVEVSGDQSQHLNKWLSKRLQTPLKAPDLNTAGYHLVGGRLLPSTEDRMAAQYMYENSEGSRVTLYIRRADWGDQSSSINYREENDYAIYYWTDNDLGYVLTSKAKSFKQPELAREVYRQMSINSVKI